MQEYQRPACRYISTLESLRLQDWTCLALSRTGNKEPCSGDSCSSSGRPRRRASWILLAGCVIGGYNVTMTKCHGVKLSKEAKAELAKGQGKPSHVAGAGLSEAEDEQRRESQKRALFSAPAKPITPYTEAEMALIAKKRDKEAEDEFLTRALKSARRNCYIYCELADLG